jgi:hypothetical protein
MYLRRNTRLFSLSSFFLSFTDLWRLFRAIQRDGSPSEIITPLPGAASPPVRHSAHTPAKPERGERYTVKPNLCSADILNGFFLRDELEIIVK